MAAKLAGFVLMAGGCAVIVLGDTLLGFILMFLGVTADWVWNG